LYYAELILLSSTSSMGYDFLNHIIIHFGVSIIAEYKVILSSMILAILGR
jgi:hypothetical protein